MTGDHYSILHTIAFMAVNVLIHDFLNAKETLGTVATDNIR